MLIAGQEIDWKLLLFQIVERDWPFTQGALSFNLTKCLLGEGLHYPQAFFWLKLYKQKNVTISLSNSDRRESTCLTEEFSEFGRKEICDL